MEPRVGKHVNIRWVVMKCCKYTVFPNYAGPRFPHLSKSLREAVSRVILGLGFRAAPAAYGGSQARSSFCFFFFLWPHLQYMEVPQGRSRIRAAAENYAAVLGKAGSLNLLSEARD